MPSYFFHLKLELYPSPAQSTHKSRRSVTPPSKTNHTFLPSRSADIFHTPLPAHKTSRWSSYTFPKYPPTTDASPASGSDFTNSPRRQPPTDTPESHGDALLLPERSLNLQHVPHSPALTPVKVSKEVSAKDWRYSAVSIESIDMELQGGSELRSGSSPVAASKTSQAKNTNGGLHTKALYLPSDPKTTEVGWGVVHLYRDAEETNLTEDKVQKQKRLGNSTQLQEDKDFDPEDCTTLCILAVPSWMMPSDLLGFVGDQAREDVSHFRLIRTGRANKYMVLLKFRTARKARDWQKMCNGRLFSAAEPENCHVVFIKSVEFLGPDEADVGSFPQNANDPFTPAARSGSGSKSLSSKPLAPPPPNLLELPTCPVCLERMDETTGLLTILCQHVFHCACLEKWRGSGCPVCRYTHSPSYTFPYPRPYGNNGDDDGEPMCSVCAATSNIWVCLICGNLGCGRYDSAHAYAHYEETSHCYAMDISTQHVWDYAGDGWVHRLIQSKPDTHLIDLPSRQRHENEAFRSEGGDSVPREKMESMAAEYTYLLTSQLEGQRRYFEEQVERAVDKASQASARADEAASHAEKAAQTASHHQQSHDDASAALAKAEKALEKSERAREKFEKLARDMSSQLREEKTMNEGLLKRIRAADEKAESAKKAADEAVEEKKELQDMVNDLTMFISSQEKVKELQAAGEEVVEGGDSGVVEGPKKKNKGKGRKK